MCTVGLVAFVLLPILTVREAATNKAWRASHKLLAAHYAEQLLAERTRDVDPVDGEEGFIEENPIFRYVLTLENYDLSTGLNEDEEEEQDALDDQGSLFSNVPSDAAVPEEEDRDNPHKVRRFEITITWPGIEDEDEKNEFLLEGFLPRVWKDEPNARFLNQNR